MLESAPKNRPQGLPTAAPLNVVVYPATNCAADMWSQFQGTSAKLFQIQVDHAQRRACLARTLDWFASASWMLDCWRVRTAEDTRDLCRWEVASHKHLPIPMRALVCDFLCGDLVKGS